MSTINGIINEDGTEMFLLKNPLWEKWITLYPPNKGGQPCSSVLGYQANGVPYMNYGCVLCSEEKCPYSNNWKVPEEDLAVWNAYQRQIAEYCERHNPHLRENIEHALSVLL